MASQILLAGLSPAFSDPAPKLSNSKVVGISLDANIAKVGAHSSWHSSKPLKTFASIHVWNASTLSEAVTAPSPATQSKNAASQTSEQGAVIPMQPTCQYSLFLGSECPPPIVSSSGLENRNNLASCPSATSLSYM